LFLSICPPGKAVYAPGLAATLVVGVERVFFLEKTERSFEPAIFICPRLAGRRVAFPGFREQCHRDLPLIIPGGIGE
jgi:hypothetical protein